MVAGAPVASTTLCGHLKVVTQSWLVWATLAWLSVDRKHGVIAKLPPFRSLFGLHLESMGHRYWEDGPGF